MLCEAGELTFECLSWDEAAFLYTEIFERKAYEQHGVTLRCGCASPGGLVVDAGANIGLFALACARTAGTAALQILAVEPISSTFEVLCRNTADHANVTPVRAALGACDLAVVHLTHFSSCPGESTRHPAERAAMRHVLALEAELAGVAHLRGADAADAPEGSEAATQLTLSSLLRQHAPTPRGAQPQRVHLLKVDVEGDELDVLLGIEPHDWERICQAVVEVHDVPPEETLRPSPSVATATTANASLRSSTSSTVAPSDAGPSPWGWSGDAPACGHNGRLARVVELLHTAGRFDRVRVVRQRPQQNGDFLSFVPEALALFHVYATRTLPSGTALPARWLSRADSHADSRILS